MNVLTMHLLLTNELTFINIIIEVKVTLCFILISDAKLSKLKTEKIDLEEKK